MASTQVLNRQPSGQQYLPQLDPTGTPSPNQYLLPLTARVNASDHLEIGGHDVVSLVEKFGSPLYILDEETLRVACRQYRDAFTQFYPGQSQVLYASKAWNCLAICALVASEGLGIDVVSGGELYTALQAGVNPAHLYFHGNNKSITELELGLTSSCTIMVDNWLELQTLAQLVSRTEAPPAKIMIRFTPGIECHTHEYIKTGHLDSKFGFDPNELDDVFNFISQQPHLSCQGLHAHIGSQIFEVQPHADLAEVMVGAMGKAQRYGLPVNTLNIGGGLGICYTEADDPPKIAQWVQIVSQAMIIACERQKMPFPKLLCEPGRSIIGPACVTAYEVGAQKTIPEMRTYISVDGGMSDNPRPITYQSVYRAVIANRMSAPSTQTVTVAGKHCESGDILIQEAQLPTTEAGDILVVPATGAYNYSMASNYNRVPRPAAVLVGHEDVNLILQRETYQDLLRQDILPERLLTAN